ncbi:MAG: hypothetical protein KDK51_00300 [Deltaproteobacteria bacterium]|nr:hypothetical protein [Deltaproteobacteria bacterium]
MRGLRFFLFTITIIIAKLSISLALEDDLCRGPSMPLFETTAQMTVTITAPFIDGLYTQENRDKRAFKRFNQHILLTGSAPMDGMSPGELMPDLGDDGTFKGHLSIQSEGADLQTYNMEIELSGRSRASDTVRFKYAPFKISIDGQDLDQNSILYGSNGTKKKKKAKIKIVPQQVYDLPDGPVFSDSLLKEYFSYELLHLLTQQSFKTKLVHLNLVDSNSGQALTEIPLQAIVIEPTKAFEARCDVSHVDPDDWIAEDPNQQEAQTLAFQKQAQQWQQWSQKFPIQVLRIMTFNKIIANSDTSFYDPMLQFASGIPPYPIKNTKWYQTNNGWMPVSYDFNDSPMVAYTQQGCKDKQICWPQWRHNNKSLLHAPVLDHTDDPSAYAKVFGEDWPNILPQKRSEVQSIVQQLCQVLPQWKTILVQHKTQMHQPTKVVMHTWYKNIQKTLCK